MTVGGGVISLIPLGARPGAVRGYTVIRGYPVRDVMLTAWQKLLSWNVNVGEQY